MNERISAHYVEVQSQYLVLMYDEYLKIKSEVVAERNKLTREERLTKYAHPTYKYVAPINENE